MPVPRSCSFNIIIKQVACGENHSAILTTYGHLYMMGSNRQGQLGVPIVQPSESQNNIDQLTEAEIEEMYNIGSPVLVEFLKGFSIEQVSCGADFTAVICRRALENNP